AYENPLLVALGSAGLTVALIRPLLQKHSKLETRNSKLLSFTLLALIIGIFIIPVPYTEYFVPIIPLLALYAATCLLNLTSDLKDLLTPRFRHSSFSQSNFIRPWEGASFVIRISLPLAILT